MTSSGRVVSRCAGQVVVGARTYSRRGERQDKMFVVLGPDPHTRTNLTSGTAYTSQIHVRP